MPKPDPAPVTIRLQLPALQDAFDRFDPAPLADRRLAPDVMAYILGRAEELDPESPLSIVVHLPDDDIGPRRAQILSDAIRDHFHQQSDWERGKRHEVFRTGRQFLAIGMAVLALGALLLWVLQRTAEDTALYTFALNSSVILGWVVIWRPAEIFFYDWLPIRKRRLLFDRIAAAPVSVEPPPV